ncbi:uncharacterized protein LOC129303425 [Prosopis cineraria]|uniref:uncharacterized protein LOC129303425 n=1 Tax=Prosopis cineraria TaxID=364024 RepID=UPI0024102DD6|nr:uncharacterized protein LOC129303425 [Prosopis cineraria]
MAFPFDGFSIREYTFKMRSVDVLKCWPFSITSSGDVSKEDLKSCLPPMTVPKFRRRSDELDAVRSDHDDRGISEKQLPDGEISISESESLKSEKSVGAEEERLDMVCPVCRVFNAATLTAVNAHIDGCLAQAMREERRQMKIMSLKPKSKAPKKKRSIAEIFEMEVEQPRIETLFKIWPFSRNPDEVSIKVTKFRWWSRQLEALRSNQSEGESSRNEKNEMAKSDEERGREEEKLEMVCPVCRAFNAATVTAVNAHIDGCLAQAMREERRHMRMNFKPSKPKAAKKRSIAEILTVAPQIKAKSNELIEIDKKEEEERSDVGDDSSRPAAASASAVFATTHSKRNKNKKKKKMERRWKKKLRKRKVEKHSGGTVTPNNDKETVNQNKNKKKQQFHNGLNAKKEDAYKRKVKTPAKSARKQKGMVGDKRAALDDIIASVHTKKASLKHASVVKKQVAVPPQQVILENYSTHIFGKASSGCNVQDDIEDKPCDVQEQISARHVTFSNKDNMLDSKKRSSSDERMFSPDGHAASSVKEQSSTSDEDTSLEVNGKDDNLAFNMDGGKEVCSIVESKQFSTSPELVFPKNILRSCADSEKKKHLVEKTESSREVVPDDDNLHLFDRGYTTAVHCSAQSSISGSLSAHQAGNISGTNTSAGDSGAYSSPGKSMDHHGNSTHQVSATNSDASTRTFMQPSLLCYTQYSQGSENSLFPSQTYGDHSQTLSNRPLSRMFSANSCKDENISLPLNSQGEPINFSPQCAKRKRGINQSEISSMLRSSPSRFLFDNIAYGSSHEYLSINESQIVQKTLSQDSVNKFPHYPARLGVTELQCSGRADIHQFSTYGSPNQFVFPLDSELNPIKYPFVEQNQHDQAQNHKRNEMIPLKNGSDLSSQSSTQPTMRLMGKDVPIGRRIKEEVHVHKFEEDVWAEQQSRRRHSSTDSALENSLLETCSKHDYLSGSPLQISSENIAQSVKIQSRQALESSALMNDPEFEFPQPFLDLQTNHVPQTGSQGFRKTAYSHTLSHAHTSRAAFNRAPQDSPEQSVSGLEFQGLGSHLQARLATCNYSQHACQSCGDLYDRKKFPLVTKPALEFPLVQPAFGEHAQTSWFQSSNRSSPPWLFTHERLPWTSSHTEWGGRFPTPVNHFSVPSCSPVNYCHMETPISPASAVQHPPLPRTPAIKPSSTIRTGCRNKTMVNDRVILEARTTNDHHSCNNARKRPAAHLQGSTKLMKFNNVEVQENLNGVPGSIQESSSCEFRRTTRTAEVDPQGDGIRSKFCCLNEAQNVMSKSYLSLEISGPGRPSPVTRHILKPSPNQDQSRPNSPAIPVAATTDNDKDLDFRRTLTKIYEF